MQKVGRLSEHHHVHSIQLQTRFKFDKFNVILRVGLGVGDGCFCPRLCV